MRTSEALIQRIEGFEGFSSVQYRDGGGVLTIGYGTTTADLIPLPQACTRQQAEGWLRMAIHRTIEVEVDKLNLENQNQYDACVDIAYNGGTGLLFPPHTLGVALAARDWEAAARAFLLYVHDANGNIEPGLVTRRRFDRDLFLKAWVNPDPYWRFDQTVVVVSRRDEKRERKASEYETVRELDRLVKRARLHPVRIKPLRENCGVLADRIERNEALTGDPHGTKNHRAYRLDQLDRRARGRKVSP